MKAIIKIKLMCFTAALLLVSTLALTAQTEGADEAAIRGQIEIYFRAHASGDSSELYKAFHPDAKVQAIKPADGQLVSIKFEDYAKTFPGKPAADEKDRKRRIETLDVTKNAASVKLVFDYPAAKITDYMLLLKIGGEWKIVNKIAQMEQKKQN